MKRIPFSFDWTRFNGRVPWFDPSVRFTPVDLPDDFCLNKHRDPDTPGGASTGFIPGGIATYRKDFVAPADWSGKTVLLGFDGAYMNAEVTLNNDLLFHHPYGYTAFFVDLTGSLRAEAENRVSVVTASIQPNSRWYSGGGLFRMVDVYIGGRAYIHPWNFFVTTPSVSADSAVVRVQGSVTNTGAACQGGVTLIARDPDGREAARAEVQLTLAQGDTAFSAELTVEKPALWDVDAPNLYAIEAIVRADGQETDRHETTFGIRSIEIDFDHGFRLNGKPMKLRGGCIHHDNTLLGACAFPRAEERKIEILKAAGYNAIRCAHNPPSEAMLNVCDRLGMLVLDESFDMWTMPKNPLDYHLFFPQWWQFDTESMVKRDRNHPCVYAWSIGNEIPEASGKSNGAAWAKKQADFVRSLDPTRPVTSALHGGFDMPPELAAKAPAFSRKPISSQEEHKQTMRFIDGRDLWGEQTKGYIDALDIVGYNYMYGRYENDRVAFPGRVIHATETHSYDTYDYWKAVERNSNVIGDFIWTAYDNLGEAGAGRVIWDPDEPMRGLVGDYPWLSCFQGDMDLCGDRRPQSYFRKILWGLDGGVHLFTTDPDHTGRPYYGRGWHWAEVSRCWSFAEKDVGRPVQLEAYADCDEVEFLVNGVSRGKSKVEKLKAFLTTPYEPGLVEAVAYKDGREIARDGIHTASKACRIALDADRPLFRADGMDLCFVAVELRDENDLPVVNAPVELNASVSGAGALAGFISGNPKTEEDFGTGRRVTWNGRALIAIRAAREAGDIQLAVTAPGLPAAICTVRCE